MGYPRANSSLSGLRSVQTKRKSVANNNNYYNKCDNCRDGAPDHGRRKLDSQAIIRRSKRVYGDSPNRGLLTSPAHSRLKCLPAEGGHGYGAVSYGPDACVRDAGGGGRGGPGKGTAAETSKRYNNDRGGNGAGGKGRKSEGQCSSGLVMEKVIILKRGQTIRDVAAGPPDDADMARASDSDDMAEPHLEGTGCSKVNWLETPDRVRDDWNARSVVGWDVRLGEIDCQDVKREAEQTRRPREDLGTTSTARPGPDPSTISPAVVGSLRPVSIGSSGRSSEVIGDADEISMILPESGGRGGRRGGTPPGSGDDLEKEAATSSLPSPVFMWEKWAGPLYCKSPSPRCLPLPKFSMQHKVRSNGKDSLDFAGLQMENGNCSASKTLNETLLSLPVFQSCANLTPQAGVDAFATRGLRRLLRLD